MLEIAEISLGKLRSFSESTCTLITIDAPLFGSVMILNGEILSRGADYVDPTKIGHCIGFPSLDQITAEASRFWVQQENGIRKRFSRQEIAKLLEDFEPVRIRQQNA